MWHFPLGVHQFIKNRSEVTLWSYIYVRKLFNFSLLNMLSFWDEIWDNFSYDFLKLCIWMYRFIIPYLLLGNFNNKNLFHDNKNTNVLNLTSYFCFFILLYKNRLLKVISNKLKSTSNFSINMRIKIYVCYIHSKSDLFNMRSSSAYVPQESRKFVVKSSF